MKTKYKSILALSIVLILSALTQTGQASGQETAIGIPERITTNQPGQPGLVWEQMDVAILPSPRLSFAMTYNPINHLALMFGGYTYPNGDINELWLTDGRQWLEFPTPHTPDVRSGASLAYDETRQAAVLFGGGNNQGYLTDTWLFNGTDWTEQHPLNSPSPRAGAGMIYDPIRMKTYLFGGAFSFEKSTWRYKDIWAWDGADWQEQFPDSLPPARVNAQMAFDRVHQNILLFGGDSYAAPLNDTWIWDGKTWSEMHPVHYPSYAFYVSGMTYDESRQKVILIGFSYDYPGYAYHPQTWAWDGSDWTELNTFQTLPQEMAYGGELVYSPAFQTVLFFNDFRKKTNNPADSIERSEVWALNTRYLSFFPRITQ